MISFNGTTIREETGKILFNGQEVKQLYFNDTSVWSGRNLSEATLHATGVSTWNISGNGVWSNLANAWDGDVNTAAQASVTSSVSPGIRLEFSVNDSPWVTAVRSATAHVLCSASSSNVALRWGVANNSSGANSTNMPNIPLSTSKREYTFELDSSQMSALLYAYGAKVPLYLPLGFARAGGNGMTASVYECWIDITYIDRSA